MPNLDISLAISTLRKPTAVELVKLLLAYVILKLLYTFGCKMWTSPLRRLKCAPGGEVMMGHHVECMS